MPRYPNNKDAILTNQTHFEILERRGLKKLTLKRTKSFQNLVGLEFDIREEHLWSYGDNLLKLSYKYYGTGDYWWGIGITNGKPTDANFEIGDVVYIISNPNSVVEAIR